MFKNLCLYRIKHDSPLVYDHLPVFTPCGTTQSRSSGFVPPRGFEHGDLVERINGHHILKLQTETKVVPSDAVRRRCNEIAEQIEDQTGRRPGKKQMKEIKEQALLELLPMALTRRSAMLIWIDVQHGLLAVDTSSAGKADEVVSLLVKCIDGLAVSYLQTESSPAGLMTAWLKEGESDDKNFMIDRECELRSCDEMRSTVKYGRHPLDIDQVREHIAMGKVPIKLALTYADRVSFLLTDGLQLRKLRFLDVCFNDRQPGDDVFDADVALATAEMRKVVDDLVVTLGGELNVKAKEPEEDFSDLGL